MANIIELKNKKTGVKQYPITKAQAVYAPDKNTVSQKLQTDEADIASLKGQVNSLINRPTIEDDELLNIRTPWYSETAEETAGEAVRNQAKNLILVQSGKPAGDALKGNKVWIKSSQDDIEIPEMSDIPSVDNTLTTEGAAADAKITGQKIIKIKESLNTLMEETVNSDIYYEEENISGTFATSSSTTAEIDFGRREINPSTLYTLYFNNLYVTDNNGNLIDDLTDYGVRIYQYANTTDSYIKALSFYNARANEYIEFTTQTTTNYIKLVFLARTSNKKDYVISAETIKIYEGEYIAPTISLKENIVIPQLDPITTRINTVTYKEIPEYYNTYIENKINNIKEKAQLAGTDGDSFIFFTDYHYANNAQNSLPIIKKIIDSVPSISHVIFGGDILNSHTKAIAIEKLYDFANNTRIINPIILYGNHENNSMGNNPIETYLDNNIVYSIIGKQNEKIAITNKDWYFYIDNPTQKIRYIFLDTGTNSNIGYVSASLAEYHHQVDQRKWLLDLLYNTENGYSVCVIAHWLFTSGSLTTYGGQLLKAILDAVKTKSTYTIGSTVWNFAEKDIDIMFALSGHTHIDLVAQETNSYPIIATTTDAYKSASDSETIPNGTRKINGQGTIYEQAFDVVQIDTKNRKIYFTRIGYGNDRVFTY